VLSRPAAVGLEMTGNHEILLPLMHAAVAEGLAAARLGGDTGAPSAQRQAA